YYFLGTAHPTSRPPLFPYTTLFRSGVLRGAHARDVPHRPRAPGPPRRRPGSALGAGSPPPHRLREGQPVRARRARDHVVGAGGRSEEHTSELQSLAYLVCRLLLEKK